MNAVGLDSVWSCRKEQWDREFCCLKPEGPIAGLGVLPERGPGQRCIKALPAGFGTEPRWGLQEAYSAALLRSKIKSHRWTLGRLRPLYNYRKPPPRFGSKGGYQLPGAGSILRIFWTPQHSPLLTSSHLTSLPLPHHPSFLLPCHPIPSTLLPSLPLRNRPLKSS